MREKYKNELLAADFTMRNAVEQVLLNSDVVDVEDVADVLRNIAIDLDAQ